MNLLTLTGVSEYVKSYEGEGTVVVASIGPDKLPTHETYVGFEGKMLGGLAVDSACAHAADCGPAHKTVEVGDR